MLAKIFVTILAVLAIFSICGALPGIANVEHVCASPGIIYVPDNYTKIQWAVDNATSGDTIIVRDGTYNENAVVNKTLTIQSENGAANCVVSASNPDDHVFHVTADWVNITGFTVENATEAYNAGIYLSTAAHCNVSNNNVMNNYRGIYLYYSSNNTLTNNTASNNWDGISLYCSSDNNLTNNTASNNWYGIFLYSSSNSMLTNNAANSNGDYGIWLASSNNNTLANNTAASNNCDGMHLYLSSNNTLTDNTCANNNHSGIYVSFSCNNNTIYNNWFNNTVNAYDEGTNIWNTTKTLGTNIIGGHYLGGNYWSDYSGNDTNRDGLGDTPYNIEGANKDYLPLTTLAFIDVIRNLPDTVQRGETFNVTVTFTAPEDKFNAIGLADFAPDGWNVTVDETWCTPNADAVLATGNKTEIVWFGELGVGFDNGTPFSALYKVTVPDYAPLGIYTFYGVLEYHLAAEGPYYEIVIGDSETDVTGATLEGRVSYIARDESPLQWIEPFLVRGFEPGNLTNELWNGTATTNTTGVFTITRLIPGTYDIGIKNWTCLSELETNVTVTGGNTTVVDFGTTREGDSNGNDAVTGIDFSLLAGAFGSIPTDLNWNANCDFNRSNAVTGMDFSLLNGNFEDVGPLYGY